MVVKRFTLLVAGLALAAACAGRSSMGSGAGDHWHAKIYRGTEGKVGEQKSIAHSSMTRLTDDNTRASITLPGLLPKGTYAWGVYEGGCTATLMGSESDYPMIVPDANSQGSFTANIHDDFQADGNYYVTIFTNGGERNEVLGCVPAEQGTG